MTRSETIQRFRQENPEIDDRVATDAVLQSWCEVGDKETCIRARLIQGETTWTATIDEERYDLVSRISSFYDIDEYPGDGVYFNNKHLTKISIAELRDLRSTWRSSSSGTPTKWFRRGKYLHLDKAPDDDLDITVYSILIPDAWNDDNKEPFNQLAYLEPFSYANVLYLKMRAKGKVGKPEESTSAMQEYEKYIAWIRKEIGGNKYSKIFYRPKI